GETDRLPRALPAPPRDLSPTSDDTSPEALSGGRAGLGAAELAAALGQLVGPVLGALPGIAPDHTDWFTFIFWALRKSRLAPGQGFAASAIHPVRGQAPPAPGETGTVADALGPPMRVDLRYDSGTDLLAPLPFGVIAADRLSALFPVYDLPDRWSS